MNPGVGPDGAPAPEPVSTARLILCALLLGCLTFWVYAPVAANGFVDYDDGAYVTQNPNVTAGLTTAGVRWAFSAVHSSNWHPLTWLSHMLDCEWFGLDARGHHLVSAALHSAGAGLCLIALACATRRRISNALLPSAVVAALFALHPLRVESVAWISERKDVLSGVFFFLTIIAYVRYVERPGVPRQAALLLVFSLGLLAKQMLVTLPCLLLLLDHWPLGRSSEVSLRRRLLEKAPLFLLAIAAGLVTVLAQRSGAAIRSVDALPIDVRVANALAAYAAYVTDTFVPSSLAFFYPHPWLVAKESFSVLGTRVLVSLGFLSAVSWAVWRLRRSRPELIVGWLWFLGLLAPVIGVLQVGAQWKADRYAYLPTLGLYIAVVFGIWRVLPTRRWQLVTAGCGFLLAALAVPLTRSQIRVWKDSPTLFRHALRVTERNYVAHSNLGFYLHNQGQLDEAELHYLRAIEYAPRLLDAHSNLGAIHIDRKEYKEARKRLEVSLALDPGHQNSRLLLGLLMEQGGDLEEAARHYRRALQSPPGSAGSPGASQSTEARVALGRVLGASGRDSEALEVLREATRRSPNHRGAWAQLADQWLRMGEPQRALDAFERARPEAGGNRNEAWIPTACAWFFATTNVDELRDAQRALALTAGGTDRSWRGLRARSAALAASGRFQEARTLALNALQAAPDEERSALRELYETFVQERDYRR